eukprot:gene5680-6561_t
MCELFRKLGSPVVLVRVGWSDDYGDQLKVTVDQPNPVRTEPLPAAWWEFADQLNVAKSDIMVIKRQWGAFTGTELDLQLRRRGITTIVLSGISTNIGVESTARHANELGYNLVIVEDACGARDAVQHEHTFKHIFPRISCVRSTQQVLAALEQ